MDSLAIILHVVAIALVGVVPACAVAWGNRRAGLVASAMIDQQPQAASAVMRAFFIGGVLNETAAMLGVIVGLMFIWRGMPTIEGALAECGAALALVIPGAAVGICAADPYAAALRAIARQPFYAARIVNWMVVLLMLLQVSVLLGFMTALFLQIQTSAVMTPAGALCMMIGGATFGIGSVGPVIGMSRFATQSCDTIGAYPESYSMIVSFAFASQALIETPLFFVLGMAMFMGYYQSADPFILASAAWCVVSSTLSAGLASGRVASSACAEIGRQPEQSMLFSGPSIVVQGFIDASVIYSMLVAVLLITRLA